MSHPEFCALYLFYGASTQREPQASKQNGPSVPTFFEVSSSKNDANTCCYSWHTFFIKVNICYLWISKICVCLLPCICCVDFSMNFIIIFLWWIGDKTGIFYQRRKVVIVTKFDCWQTGLSLVMVVCQFWVVGLSLIRSWHQIEYNAFKHIKINKFPHITIPLQSISCDNTWFQHFTS